MEPRDISTQDSVWQKTDTSKHDSEKPVSKGTSRDGRRVSTDGSLEPELQREEPMTGSGNKSLGDMTVTAAVPTASVKEPVTTAFQMVPFKYGPIELPPFTVEQAKDFFAQLESFKNEEKPNESYQDALFSLYKAAGAEKQDLRLINGGFDNRIPDTYDENFYGRTAPTLRHSQIVIADKQGAETRLPANRISYDGKNYGVAMPASVAADLGKMSNLIWQEQTGVLIDLYESLDGGGDLHKESNTKACWGSLQTGKPQARPPYIIEKTHEQPINNETQLQRFKIKHSETGEERTFSRIHYTAWVDMKGLALPQLEELHKLIDEEQLNNEGDAIAVNCLAGVGRTGTLFATRRIRDKAKNHKLDSTNLDAESLNVMIQGKMARNNHFVQSCPQAQLVRESADYYAEMYPS